MLLEIGFSQEAAIGAHKLIDLVCDFPPYKSIATFFSDHSQGLRKVRVLENVAFCRRSSLAVQGVSLKEATGKFSVKLRAKMPVKSDQFRNRETLFCISNRGRKIVAQFQFTEFPVQFRPRVHGSRHADR